MDADTDAMDMLLGNIYPLRLGYDSPSIVYFKCNGLCCITNTIVMVLAIVDMAIVNPCVSVT